MFESQGRLICVFHSHFLTVPIVYYFLIAEFPVGSICRIQIRPSNIVVSPDILRLLHWFL